MTPRPIFHVPIMATPLPQALFEPPRMSFQAQNPYLYPVTLVQPPPSQPPLPYLINGQLLRPAPYSQPATVYPPTYSRSNMSVVNQVVRLPTPPTTTINQVTSSSVLAPPAVVTRHVSEESDARSAEQPLGVEVFPPSNDGRFQDEGVQAVNIDEKPPVKSGRGESSGSAGDGEKVFVVPASHTSKSSYSDDVFKENCSERPSPSNDTTMGKVLLDIQTSTTDLFQFFNDVSLTDEFHLPKRKLAKINIGDCSTVQCGESASFANTVDGGGSLWWDRSYDEVFPVLETPPPPPLAPKRSGSVGLSPTPSPRGRDQPMFVDEAEKREEVGQFVDFSSELSIADNLRACQTHSAIYHSFTLEDTFVIDEGSCPWDATEDSTKPSTAVLQPKKVSFQDADESASPVVSSVRPSKIPRVNRSYLPVPDRLKTTLTRKQTTTTLFSSSKKNQSFRLKTPKSDGESSRPSVKSLIKSFNTKVATTLPVQPPLMRSDGADEEIAAASGKARRCSTPAYYSLVPAEENAGCLDKDATIESSDTAVVDKKRKATPKKPTNLSLPCKKKNSNRTAALKSDGGGFDWAEATALWNAALKRLENSSPAPKEVENNFKERNHGSWKSEKMLENRMMRRRKRFPSMRGREWKRSQSLPSKSNAVDGSLFVKRRRKQKKTEGEATDKDMAKKTTSSWRHNPALLASIKKVIGRRSHIGRKHDIVNPPMLKRTGPKSRLNSKAIPPKASTLASPEALRCSNNENDHIYIELFETDLGSSFVIEPCTFVGSSTQGVYMNSQTGQVMEKCNDRK